jgi:hypothetical protein
MDIYPIGAHSLPWDVFTGSLPNNGCPSVVRCALVGMCLLSSGVLSLHSLTLWANPSQYCNDIGIKTIGLRSEVSHTPLRSTSHRAQQHWYGKGNSFGSTTLRNSGKYFLTCYSISLSIFFAPKHLVKQPIIMTVWHRQALLLNLTVGRRASAQYMKIKRCSLYSRQHHPPAHGIRPLARSDSRLLRIPSVPCSTQVSPSFGRVIRNCLW